MFAKCKKCKNRNFNVFNSFLGILILNSKLKKGEKSLLLSFFRKFKIHYGLKIQNITESIRSLDTVNERKPFTLMGWKELQLSLELIFLIRELAFHINPTLFQSQIFPFLRSKTDFLVEILPGGGKCFLYFFFLIDFLWLKKKKKKKEYELRKQYFILVFLESDEEREELLNLISNFSVFYGVYINKNDQLFNSKPDKLIYGINFRRTDSFFVFQRRNLQGDMDIKLIIIEILSFLRNPAPLLFSLKNFLEKHTKITQKLIFVEAKIFSLFFPSFNSINKGLSLSFFPYQNFSFQIYELCRNSYSKLLRFLEILPYFNESIFILTQNTGLSVLFSKIIPYFYKNKNSFFFRMKSDEKSQDHLNKPKIFIGNYINENLHLNTQVKVYFFFDNLFNGKFPFLNFHFEDNNKKFETEVFFLKNSEKNFLKKKIQNFIHFNEKISL